MSSDWSDYYQKLAVYQQQQQAYTAALATQAQQQRQYAHANVATSYGASQGFTEEQRIKAWQAYYAQQNNNQQQPAAGAPAPSTMSAPTPLGTPSGGYNSFSQWYGSGSVAAASAPTCAQQQSGQVIGAGRVGTPAISLSTANITQAAVQAAALCRPSTSATSSSGGFQGFQAYQGWPPALRAWVERAFAACKSDAERGNVQTNLRARIQRANETNSLWSTQWDSEPLPERSSLWLPPPNSLAEAMNSRGAYGGGGYGGGRADDGAPTSLSRSAKKRKAKKGVNLYSRDDDDDERQQYGPSFDEFEAQKRQKRMGRFDDGAQQASRRGGSNRWNAPVPTRSLDAGGADVELDYTVVGTCQKVDKKYLRLTAAPDPETVRPEPVLKQAVQMITEKYESFGEERGQEQYIYLWERMKAVRQDLTVQHVRNEFTVQVYEMHARICLEFDDRTEFQQCQAQLSMLYEEGLGTADAKREFAAYNILYNVGKGAYNNVSDLMLALSPEDRNNEFIDHALKVRAAEALGDYCRLFRLYASAPGHAQHVMDTFADRARLEALRVMLKAYAPTMPLPLVTRSLGHDAEEDCAFFLEDHGVVVSAAPAAAAGTATGAEAFLQAEMASPRLIDCKASRASLVEHSISQKAEEERKDAARKAEIVPISFS